MHPHRARGALRFDAARRALSGILFQSLCVSFLGAMRGVLVWPRQSPRTARSLRSADLDLPGARVVGLARLSRLSPGILKILLKLNDLTRFYAVHIKTG